MAFLRRLTETDEDRLIAGEAPARGDLAELAAFTSAMRASASAQAVPPASAAFIARLAETARRSAQSAEDPRSTVVLRPLASPARPRRRLALVARVAVAVATVPLLFAGLAFAGVGLPGPADDAFESLGVELPNQAADTDDDTEGTAKDGDSAGSATGQQNSAGKLGHGRTKDRRGKALGHDKQRSGAGRGLGKDGQAPGQIKDKGSLGNGGSANAGANSNAGGNPGASSGGGGGSGKSGGGSEGSPGGGPPPGKGPSK